MNVFDFEIKFDESYFFVNETWKINLRFIVRHKKEDTILFGNKQ